LRTGKWLLLDKKNRIMEFSKIDKNNFEMVAQIYKTGIETGNATFETRVPTFEEWDKKHLSFGRIVILENDEIKGWAALSKVSERSVYNGVAEVSIYISVTSQGKGIGTQLLQKLIEISEINGIWTLQCGIMQENVASINLHRKCGFREIGYREKIGKINDCWRNNVILERRSKVTGI
jgi:L-amino acid N-acyltransferase YncA